MYIVGIVSKSQLHFPGQIVQQGILKVLSLGYLSFCDMNVFYLLDKNIIYLDFSRADLNVIYILLTIYSDLNKINGLYYEQKICCNEIQTGNIWPHNALAIISINYL